MLTPTTTQSNRSFFVDDTYWNRGKFVTRLEGDQQQLKLIKVDRPLSERSRTPTRS
jgi:hypothetical protein